MRFAYADPPYIGQAKRHYGTTAKEVNHRVLIGTLCQEYPDGWALSSSSTTLRQVLEACPTDGIRIGAWVKPFASFKPGINPAYAWEPVVFFGGRKRGKSTPTVRDWVSANITLKRGVAGAKPDTFCYWLFDLLGAEPEDEFTDIFPGSGAISRAWQRYQAQVRMNFK